MAQSKFEFDPEHEQIEKITCSSGGRLPYQSEVFLTPPSFLLLFPSLFLTLFSRTSKRYFCRGGIFSSPFSPPPPSREDAKIIERG